jgi:hypothetical protein
VKRGLLLAAALLGLAGCGAPPPPAAHPELGILTGADAGATSGFDLRRIPGGESVATLPAGQGAFALSGGGDIAEGYLARSVGGTFEVDAVRPDRGFALGQVAALDGEPKAAVLVRAEVTNFVGLPNVLIVATGNGRLIGFQHGAQLWSSSTSGPTQLRIVGGKAYAGDNNGWSPINGATGTLGPIVTSTSCQPGPIALLDGNPLLDCGGTLSGSLQRIPPGPAAATPVNAGTVLVFAGDEVWRAGRTSSQRVATGVRATVAPVAAADSRTVYVPTAAGVERLDTATGSHGMVVAEAGITSLGLSRDGNFLYVIAGGRLTTYAAATGNRVGSFRTDRTTLYLVAGG